MAVEHFAFSEDQVSALTGLSKRQLRWWDKTDFFSPEFYADGRRVYSFRDLVGLRAIAPIRDRMPLQQLRKIDRALHEEFRDDHPNPWASIKFFLAGRELIYKDPRNSALLSTMSNRQTVTELDLEEVKNETVEKLHALNRRGDADIGKIRRRRNVVGGAMAVAGTRIPTSLIYEYVEAGFSTEKIISEFPSLKEEDVKAAVGYERSRRASRRTASAV